MEETIAQILKALKAEAYYSALFVCITIPDICGAIDSVDGEAHYSKYIKWFDTYVADNYKNWLTGKEMYTLRCNLLHQGTANLQKHKYSRIVFQEPNQYRYVDNMVIGDILIINVETFCSHIINGIIEWYNSAEHSPEFLRNYSKMIRRHPDGLSPMISDVPVIC